MKKDSKNQISKWFLHIWLLMLFFVSPFNSYSQKYIIKEWKGNDYTGILKSKKVKSISYFYSNKKRNISNKMTGIEYYDSFGRITTEIYFDSSNVRASSYRYYYVDTTSELMYRIERLDKNDSIYSISESQIEDGKIIYVGRLNEEYNRCFGYFKYKFGQNGLIEEYIWYGPKRGIYANNNMKAYYTLKLEYTFYP
jgi:hypothetical protein